MIKRALAAVLVFAAVLSITGRAEAFQSYNVNGTFFSYPDVDDTDWGQSVTDWARAVSSACSAVSISTSAIGAISRSTSTLGLTASNTNYFNLSVATQTKGGGIIVTALGFTNGTTQYTSAISSSAGAVDKFLLGATGIGDGSCTSCNLTYGSDGRIYSAGNGGGAGWINKANADTSISSYSITFSSSYGTIPGMTWPVMKTQLQPASSAQFTWDMYGTMYRSTGVCMGCWVPTTTKGWHPSSGAVLSIMFDESSSTPIYDSINSNGIDASSVVGHALSGRWVSISTGLNGERTAFEVGKSTGEIVFPSDSRFANGIGAGKWSGCIAWYPYDLTLNSSLMWQGDTGDFGPQVGYGEFGSALGFITNTAAGSAVSSVKHQNTPNLNAWNTTCWRYDVGTTQHTQIWLNGVASNINSTEAGGTVNPGSTKEVCFGARCDSRQIEQFNGMFGLIEIYLDNMTDARALAFDQIRRFYRTQR